MEIKVIASGSSGNCTAISTGNAIILLDAGIGYKKIQPALKHVNPTAALITHEHGDHAKLETIQKLLDSAVEVYMTEGTADELQLEETYNLHLIRDAEGFEVAGLDVLALASMHDAVEPVNYVLSSRDESIWYITDDGDFSKAFFRLEPPTKILIEANHAPVKVRLDFGLDNKQVRHILTYHASIVKTANFLSRIDRSRLQEVHLIHISKRFGDKAGFRGLIRDRVNVPVYAH